MKVLTFSRVFPAYHPRAGEPTNFVEQIWKSLYVNGECPADLNKWMNDYPLPIVGDYNDTRKKVHTIRAGHRFNPGDWFSARVWADKPYRSKQIEFAKIQVAETIPLETHPLGYYLNGVDQSFASLEVIARNDCLSLEDFESWFDKELFSGQIISWYPNLYKL